MKNLRTVLTLLSLSAASSISYATNGDILTGEGAISQALGGVGVAAPQDAITSISANPATLSLRTGVNFPAENPIAISPKDGKAFKQQTPSDSGVEINFDGTVFVPKISTQIGDGSTGVKSDSHSTVFPIPEFAVSLPVTADRDLYFGLAAYGSAGLGVDYRGNHVENSKYYNFGGGQYAPLAAGTYTNFGNLKFVPALSYRVTPELAVGLGVQIDYSTLDLGQGTATAYGLGVKPGIVYHPTDNLTFGATYTTAQPTTFHRVNDFNGDGVKDDLKLEGPQEAAIGGAIETFDHRLLLEANGKWINWSNADGYKDFAWKDQWVAAVGAQFAVIPEKLFLRVGYNYGNNPVKTHDGFNGAFCPSGSLGYTTVQGKKIPNYYYEAFRIVGFPAVVEQHASVGVGYAFNKNFTGNLAYTHAFATTISEQGTNPFGQATTIQSKLSEDSLEIGLTWKY